MRRGLSALIAATITLAPMLIALTGCRSSAPAESDTAPEPAPVMAVTGAKVIVKPMHSDERLLGETVAMRHLTMRAPAAGRVLGLNLQTGDRVRRGEIVAHVLSREVEAAENGLAIAQQIDPANAAHLAASVKRYSHDSGVAVPVPEDALVAQRMVSSGQMVADLDPLVDLIDPRSIAVNVTVPAAALAMIHPGMAARVTSPIHPGEVYPAQVVAIAPSFNQGGATSSARVEFTSADRILESGAPAEVRITSADVPDAIVIPLAALFQDATNDSYYVFIATPNGRAHRVPVTIGLREGGEVQVTKGLHAGQVVITSGGYALSDGLNVNVAMAAQ
jgi:multidrug efflux pump subunit AcrA (membrane-fusion protein)